MGSVVLAYKAGVLIMLVIAAAAQGSMVTLGAVQAVVHVDAALSASLVEIGHGALRGWLGCPHSL
jgi:hypothetical protein